MKRHLHYRNQPLVCSCQHATDTAEWHGKRRSGAGLHGNGAAHHLSSCIHSTLWFTTQPLKQKRSIPRLKFVA